jgi:Flp pilus assembly protein TadD
MTAFTGRVATFATIAAVALLCLAQTAVEPVSAQSSGAEPLERAVALRNARDFEGAIQVLEEVVRDHPRDVAALRLLAQTLYWVRRDDDAVRRYAEALELAPNDDALRREYGRTLVELSRRSAAHDVLSPLRERGDAEAIYLLGLSDYWRGDFNAARAAFRAALAADPAHTEAARVLAELRAASSPWLRLEPQRFYDAQQLNSTGFTTQAGVFFSPLHTLALEGSTRRFNWSDSSTTVVSGLLGTRAHWPGARLSTELALGAAHWSAGDSTSLIGRAVLELRMAGNFTLTAAAERSPYVATTASLTTPLAPDRAELRLALNRGVLGEAVARLERFPDENRVRTAYAWLLMPLVRGRGGDLRIGYAVAAQDAEQDREIPVLLPSPPVVPPGQPPRFRSRFTPYHTPQRRVVHSVAGALSVRPSNSIWLSANGSWGFRAREDASLFVAADTVPGSPPVREVSRREFHPFELRGAANVVLNRRVSAFVEAFHMSTAFYDATRFQGGLLFRFLPNSP